MIKPRLKYGLAILFFFQGLSFLLTAQNRFGNEWINFSQSYYAISVTQNGIYQVTASQLQSAGVPISSISPNNLQLWHRGQQVAIQTVANGAGTLDYFLFYGIKNDGWQDSAIYTNPSLQTNKYLNLFSDATTFFLTWSNSFSKRASVSSVVLDPNLLNSYSWESRHNAELLTSYYDDYSVGTGSSDDPEDSYWTAAEGWCTGGYPNQTNPNFTPTISVTSSLSGNYNFSGVLLGRNNAGNSVSVSDVTNPLNSNLLGSVSFGGNTSQSFSFDYSGAPSNNQLNYSFSQQESGGLFSVVYLKLTYPQSLDMAGANWKVFNLNANSGNVSYLKVSNAPTISSSSSYTIFDITDYKNIVSIPSSSYIMTGPNEISFAVPNTSSPRKILVMASLLTPVEIRKANFRAYSSTSKTFMILTHRALMKPYGTSTNVIGDYAAYRYSSQGGSYDTLTVDIQNVYDQFGYGEVTPLAVRKFCDFITQNQTEAPQFLFIIGKGMEVNVPNARFALSQLQNPNLVPPFGYPGSDIVFSAGLTGSSGFNPAIPTGRISATSAEEVYYYLNKVKTFESTPFEIWRKNLVHLSGGAPDVGTMTSIAGYMSSFAGIASGPLLGGNIASFQKRTDAVYQLFDLTKQLTQGLLLINAFGHSAQQVTEIDIGYPSNPTLSYPSNGKYPFVIINGCDAGNAFLDNVAYSYGNTNRSIGEDWILVANKGSIGFLAHSAKGYVSPLGDYGNIMYTLAFADSQYFSQPIGVIQKETIRRFSSLSQFNNSYQYYYPQSQQMVLQGDPAIVLFGPLKSDYATSDAEVFIKSYSNNLVDATSDSFAIGVIVTNLGRGVNDSLGVCISRTLPNGTVINYPTKYFAPVLNTDTLYYKVKFSGEDGFGINNFTVTLNCGNKIQELNYSNNTGSYQYFMSKKTVLCLSPPEFSIVSAQPVNFVAQTTDQLSTDTRQFFYQVDTSAYFNSPFLKTGVITGNALAEWKLSLLPDVVANDSTVYYWRVHTNDATNGSQVVWTNSSFLYIKNSPTGWSQSKFNQFYKLTNQGVVKDTINRKWAFENTPLDVKVTTEGASVSGSGTNTSVALDGDIIIANASAQCGDYYLAGIHGFAIDQYSLTPYQIVNTLSLGLSSNDEVRRFQCYTGNISGNVVNKFIVDITNNGWANYGAYNFGNLLLQVNNVKYGDIIVFYSVGDAGFGNSGIWSPTYISLFQSLGAKEITKLKSGWPYIFIARKGIPGSVIEILPDTNSAILPAQQLITYNAPFQIKENQGSIISPAFGPAYQWGNLFYQVTGNDAGTNDIFNMQILGKTSAGADTTLYSGIPQNGMDVSWINASKFQSLRLKSYFKDTINDTPLQLKKWQLIYQQVPEGTLITDNLPSTTYQNISKLEGDSLKLPFYFKNISTTPFKAPLIVDYTVLAGNQKIIYTDTLKIPLMPDSIWTLKKYSLSTVGLSGKNNFQVYVNPKLQMEQYYPNNFYSLFFNVQKDNKNPVLDVAFDGVHIMNGDIVSPSPVITITMNDDNPYVLKKDTLGMSILMKNCQDPSCNFTQISFLSPDVTYQPATNSNNKFQITYHPKNLVDGTYTLRVQGTDATGNQAGLKAYQTNFQVINQSAMTYFFPYPNPFSSHTQFAYTLTGSQIPDEIKIQILTVSGRVVREILQNELGPLLVGTHLTTYVWDGTDEFGSKLANGVYFYKVYARANGQDMSNRSTAADKAFTESYGKLYIMR